jgi:branched-chain amino acid aminotransferase
MNYCYLNGQIIPESKAHISIHDLGLLRGYGVFEFLRTYHGKLLLPERNLDRLEHSAATIGLQLPISRKHLLEIIRELIARNDVDDAGIRIILTGGETPDGTTYITGSSTLLMTISDLVTLPQSVYDNGVTLITCEHHRDAAEAKTINYLKKVSLQKHKEVTGAHEVLYVCNGSVLECTSSNFFIFFGDILVTPKDDILKGTRRGIILELASSHFTVEERSLGMDELANASEAFITSTTRDILPVVRVDQIVIGNENVGKNTRILMRLFQEFVDRACG